MILAAALLVAAASVAQAPPPSGSTAPAPAALLGSSKAGAIVVRSVGEEYAWLRARALRPTRQALIVDGKRAFDMFQASDAQGGSREVWFDISSFYGREFGF